MYKTVEKRTGLVLYYNYAMAKGKGHNYNHYMNFYE